MKIEFSKSAEVSNFMKIHSVRSEFYPTDRQTDGWKYKAT